MVAVIITILVCNYVFKKNKKEVKEEISNKEIDEIKVEEKFVEDKIEEELKIEKIWKDRKMFLALAELCVWGRMSAK